MTELEDAVARVVCDAVPADHGPLDGAAIRRSAERRRYIRTFTPVLAAAVVLAVAVSTWWFIQRPANEPAAEYAPTRTHLSTPAGTSPSADSPREVTTRAARRLVAAVRIPPGATSLDRSPTTLLDMPSSSGGNVDQTKWLTAPGTVASTLQYLRTHPPAGTTPSGGSSTGGAGPHLQAIFFDATGPQWQQPTEYTGLSLVIGVVDYGGGVAIRVDAEATWLAQRTAAERLPTSVTSVDVTVDRQDSAPTVHRTLGAVRARALAQKINNLDVFPAGIFHCPLDRGYRDTLVFHDRSGVIRVEVAPGGCGPVTVYRPGPLHPGLAGGPAVHHVIVADLGLPSNYNS